MTRDESFLQDPQWWKSLMWLNGQDIVDFTKAYPAVFNVTVPIFTLNTIVRNLTDIKNTKGTLMARAIKGWQQLTQAAIG